MGTLSSVRTRTSLTRSRIFWTSSVRVAAPSTTWTSRGVALSRRRRSCRVLWRRPRAPSSRRRTRSSVPSLSLDRSSRRLTGVWPRRRKFNNTRKNHARAMESMSASLEAEQKAKGEALRVKKALEGEINELEIGLDHANKANSEGLKSIKRYQGQLKETIQLYEDEARSRSQIMEQIGISERKAAALSGELEESEALMDSSERSKRQLEMEIADGRNAVNNMQVINGRDMTAKRGLEGAIHTIQAEVDAMLGAAKNAEEKSKKAMVDAARLADELRAEQDHASAQASSKQSLNNQFGQLEARLADAENAAARGGKAAMAKPENKVHELEAELAGTQARTGESAKAYQRAERKCKELVFSSGEDKKNQERTTELASKLQQKIKTHKKQIEED